MGVFVKATPASERYLSHGWSKGGSLFLTYQTSFPLISQSLQHPSTPRYLAMAYFNDSDNFYSASATPEELDSYPFLQCQTPATTDRVYRQETQTFAGSWATVDQLGPPTITPTGLGATSYGERSSRFLLISVLCTSPSRTSPSRVRFILGPLGWILLVND